MKIIFKTSFVICLLMASMHAPSHAKGSEYCHKGIVAVSRFMTHKRVVQMANFHSTHVQAPTYEIVFHKWSHLDFISVPKALAIPDVIPKALMVLPPTDEHIAHLFAATFNGSRASLDQLIALANKRNSLAAAYLSICAGGDFSRCLLSKEEISSYGQHSIEWIKFESLMQNLYAQYILGVYHECGIIVELNAREAFRLYEKSGAAGYPPAQNNLAVMLFQGSGVEKDINKAMTLFISSASQGCAPAQCNLGQIAESGISFPVNYELAASLYLQAADQGYAPAQYNLGAMYLHGNGVKKGYLSSQRWISRAADQVFWPDSAGPNKCRQPKA